MFRRPRDDISYTIGFVTSALGHALCFILSLTVLGHSKADMVKPYEVFSVTLEGGQKLGGISQAPEEKWTKKALPNAPSSVDKAADEKIVKEEVKLDQPTVVDDPEKLLKEMREKELQEKKKKEQLEQEKREKSEAEKKKQQEEKIKQAKADEASKERERRERDRRLQRAIANASSKYLGESANAGGEGFGAAALGGQGMGGGKLESVEFIAYRNQLEEHIKSGWRWLPGPDQLVTQVEFVLLADGTVQDAQIVASSGNRLFDDSALRAVYKASPAPAPPSSLYDRFRQIRITFDSAQQ